MDHTLILTVQVVSLPVAIAYVASYVGKVFHGQPVSQKFMYIMSTSVTAFVAVTWLI